MRALNAGAGVARRSGEPARVAGTAVPAALAGLGVLHAAWALGWRRPGGDDEAFAATIYSPLSLALGAGALLVARDPRVSR